MITKTWGSTATNLRRPTDGHWDADEARLTQTHEVTPVDLGVPTIAAISTDPGYTGGGLWGMYGDDLGISVGPSGTTNAFGSQAEKAWDAGFTVAKSVAVGIVDSNDAVANYPSNYSTLPSGSYGTSSAATRRAGISRSASLPRRPAADRPRYSPQGCSFSAEKNAA